MTCIEMSSGDRYGSILLEAHKIINGERRGEYGGVEDSFQIIADLWNPYIKSRMKTWSAVGVGHGPEGMSAPIPALRPRDIAMMMCLMKVARETHAPKRDSLVDIAGYAALAEAL